jgi:membrane protein YdbS with pleckstrin-like domain
MSIVQEKIVTPTLEVTHLNIRESIVVLFFKLFLIEIIFMGALLLGCLPGNCALAPLFGSDVYQVEQVLFFVSSLGEMGLTFFVIYQWINEYYEIYPDRITHRSGFIFQTKDVWSLKNIVEIEFEQGIAGRFFNWGTIRLFDRELKQKFSLYMIHNPHKYYAAIRRLLPSVDQEKHVIIEGSSHDDY